MKKIIALILVIGCVFAFASCNLIFGNNDGGNGHANDNKGTVADVQSAIDASAPAKATIKVKLESALGDLNGSYNVTYNEDGSATVNYSYEVFNAFGEDATKNGEKSTYSDTVTVSASGELNKPIYGASAVEAVSFDINLDESKLSSASVVASVLTAKVEAANTAAVLGVAISSDADLCITTGAGRVTSVVITYTTESGPVTITATYNY